MQTRPVPSVSVVMPAYNAEKYLREAIDSILAQTYKDFEFIIINDGSTDRTKEIILSYSDPRIVYLENEENSGICVTLNKGLDAARGRYIARMDSDDIALPDRFAIQVDYMDQHPDIGVCGSDIEVFGEGIEPHIFTQLHTPGECAAGLLFNPCFAHPSVFIRKEIIDKYDLRYKDEFRGLEDFELWWQISKYSKLNNIAKALLKYRHHKGQETQNVCERTQKAFAKFLNIRYSDLGIELDNCEARYLRDYACGSFGKFGSVEIEGLIKLSRRIINEYPSRDEALQGAVKLTLAKCVTFTINNSPQLKRQRYYNKAFLAGVLPISWFCKITYHNIFK